MPFSVDNSEPYTLPAASAGAGAGDKPAARFSVDNSEPYTIPPPDPGFLPAMGRAVQHGISENPILWGADAAGKALGLRSGKPMSWSEWRATGEVPGEVAPTGAAEFIGAPLRGMAATFPLSLRWPRAVVAGSEASELAKFYNMPELLQEGAGMIAGGLTGIGGIGGLLSSLGGAARQAPGMISNMLHHPLRAAISSGIGAYLGHRISPEVGHWVGAAAGPLITDALLSGGRRLAPYAAPALMGGAAGWPSWSENELTGPPTAQ